MRKDPAQRPSSAGEVAAALRRIIDGTRSSEMQQPARPAIHSIAVLPLRNISGDPAQEYFVAGMTEQIISDLSRIKALRVISRTSAMKYKDTTLSLPEVARELNVDAVLEGSALLVGTRVRAIIQLVRARDEETLWSDRYDRNIEDVLMLQSELAETVVKEIAVQLTPAEATNLAASPQPINREAYDHFLQSRHSSFSGTREGIDLGLRHARKAIEIDEGFAPAWAALSDCYAIQALRGLGPFEEGMADAMKAAKRAVDLDPALADAHASLGFVEFYLGNPHEGISRVRRAIELNPSHAMAHNVLARALTCLACHDESIVEAQKAVALDPLGVLNHATVADAYYFAREYEKSVLAYKIALETDPRFDGAHTDLARALEALGRFDEARAAVNEGRRLAGPATAAPSFGLAHIEAASGNEAAARSILNELIESRGSRVISAWGIAALFASLGDIEEAFKWLDTAVAEKASGLVTLRVHPRMDPIRTDPRYWPLVKKVGLAD